MLNSSSRSDRRRAKDAPATARDTTAEGATNTDPFAILISPDTTPAGIISAGTISAAPTPVNTPEAPAQSRRELRERAERAAASQVTSGRVASERTRSERVKPARIKPTRVRPARVTVARTRPEKAPALVVTSPARPARPVRAVGFKRRMVSKLVTVSAMAGAGLMLVATTVPANAFARPEAAEISAVSTATAKTQELTVEAAAAPALTKDGYTVVSLARQVQASYGNRTFTYTNNPNGAVQWPFPDGSPIASGFGARQVAGCGFCSTYHKGLDFTPGSGTPIHSLAAGVVSDVSTGGAFGNHVLVSHVINGQKVETLYAHMQYGSIRVAVGQSIGVGDVIGKVGSTGNSTGAHLHLEVHLDGTPVDPYAWLKANAN